MNTLNSTHQTSSEAMYLPVLVELRDLTEFLKRTLTDDAIPEEVVISECVRTLFGELPHMYNTGPGVVGAVKMLLPRNHSYDDAVLEGFEQKCMQLLVSDISCALPFITTDTCRAYYPGGNNIVIYVCVDVNTLDENARRKAIPGTALQVLTARTLE